MSTNLTGTDCKHRSLPRTIPVPQIALDFNSFCTSAYQNCIASNWSLFAYFGKHPRDRWALCLSLAPEVKLASTRSTQVSSTSHGCSITPWVFVLSEVLMASRGDRMFGSTWQESSSTQTCPDGVHRYVVSGRWRLLFLFLEIVYVWGRI